jgi:hypothetical protein
MATLEEEPILAVEDLCTFVVHGTAGTQETERESGRIFAGVSVVKGRWECGAGRDSSDRCRRAILSEDRGSGRVDRPRIISIEISHHHSFLLTGFRRLFL